MHDTPLNSYRYEYDEYWLSKHRSQYALYSITSSKLAKETMPHLPPPLPTPSVPCTLRISKSCKHKIQLVLTRHNTSGILAANPSPLCHQMLINQDSVCMSFAVRRFSQPFWFMTLEFILAVRFANMLRCEVCVARWVESGASGHDQE